jgi:protease-4
MSVAAVDKVAKGREWTGAQAKDLGLVDELGGFDRAIELAKDLAHVPANASVRIVRFPEEKSLFQQLFEREKQMMEESESASVQTTLQRIIGSMDPVQARITYQLRIR